MAASVGRSENRSDGREARTRRRTGPGGRADRADRRLRLLLGHARHQPGAALDATRLERSRRVGRRRMIASVPERPHSTLALADAIAAVAAAASHDPTAVLDVLAHQAEALLGCAGASIHLAEQRDGETIFRRVRVS